MGTTEITSRWVTYKTPRGYATPQPFYHRHQVFLDAYKADGRRWVGRCKACSEPRRPHGVAAVSAHQVNNGPHLFCGCGRLVPVQKIDGVHNPDKGCNARCESATGSSCECSCGGENHGAAW